MATQKQIQANRANGAKSKGPVSPEGKRIALNNLALPGIISGTILLKRESMRRYNDLAASLILQFQPRNPAETFQVHVMTAASWRLLRIRGIQTADFQREMARQDPAAGSKDVLAAITLRNLAENSRALSSRAMTTPFELRQTPDPRLDSNAYPPIRPTTETRDEYFFTEANSETPAESGSGLNEWSSRRPLGNRVAPLGTQFGSGAGLRPAFCGLASVTSQAGRTQADVTMVVCSPRSAVGTN